MAPCCAPAVVSEASQQEAVAACLARLKPGHFQAKRLAFEIRDVGFTPAGSLSTLQLLVRWIYERSVNDAERYAAPCASLCFSLTPILPTFKPPGALTASAKVKRIDFRQTLLNLCQREFEAAYGQVASASSTPTAEAAADKAVGSLAGSLQFLAYLYLHHLLTDRIMLSCLLRVASDGQSDDGRIELSGSGGHQRAECLVKALLIAGRQLDECLAQQHRPHLDGLFEHLQALRSSSSSNSGVSGSEEPPPPPELLSSLSRLLELRAEGWASGAALSTSGQSTPPAASAAPHGRPAMHSKVAKLLPPRPMSYGGSATSPSGRPNGASVVGAALPLGATAAARRAAAAAAAATGPKPGPAPAAQASGVSTPLSRRASSSGSLAGSGLKSRGSCQNLEGLWDLSAETYNDVRGQLLSQPVADSPATLEALADEMVESAVAACGGDADCPCWGGQQCSGFSPRAAPDMVGVSSPGFKAESLSDAEWAQLVQQQWDEQLKACDMYVRLCVDALQQMSTCSPGPSPLGPAPAPAGADPEAASSGSSSCSRSSSAGAALGEAGPGPSSSSAARPPGAVVASDTGRAFRRLLLSAAQTHFERALSALQAAPPSRSPSPPPSESGAPAEASADSASGVARASSSGASDAVGEERRDWGDIPESLPDVAASLPRARGVCHLLLGLLRHGVLTPRIVLGAAAALVDGAVGGSDGCLQCACMLLVGAGTQVRTFKVSEAAAFESLVKRVQALPDAFDSDSKDQLRRRFVAWTVGSLQVS